MVRAVRRPSRCKCVFVWFGKIADNASFAAVKIVRRFVFYLVGVFASSGIPMVRAVRRPSGCKCMLVRLCPLFGRYVRK